jgi:hypothetical protein
LMVYVPGAGPIAEPEDVIRDRFPAEDDTASQATRNTMKAMFSEWSLAWGKDVAGWWMDGCWGPEYNDVNNGAARKDELLSVMRLGNPESIVTCNPSIQLFTAESREQDYVAGEEQAFHRYPGLQSPRYMDKAQMWHVLSYLGSNWGYSDVNYEAEQVARYIEQVHDRNGVVTIDLGIKADGSLYTEQFPAMHQVNSYIRGTNLAKAKPTRLVSSESGVNLPTKRRQI